MRKKNYWVCGVLESLGAIALTYQTQNYSKLWCVLLIPMGLRDRQIQ
ncbi:hypothetical protein G7B40_015320 [Aetokthonos hydrillicola Thurmond2011]|uniref:Uncharacterized protein n=1 Tax=Aetokthonos hydrillicola Thurmond2011 TaxID=2712845 RepID=A0AAP5MAI9_9CYAN|nr:hypothetical protein [Aetokthonos hydrillicola]MBO3461644.1 hypothetical protein [Aetokthonos hydrillicola CCALA 1050]MBW4588743.1 hypothetical protein [Aetokthonos hydrillicola CCALA 1050]MDR9895923.1 hypothetical protein [Aetokthonos hydrillicola Thurmond2011]